MHVDAVVEPARDPTAAPAGERRTGSPPVPMWRPVRGGNAFEITVARLAQAIKLGLVVRR